MPTKSVDKMACGAAPVETVFQEKNLMLFKELEKPCAGHPQACQHFLWITFRLAVSDTPRNVEIVSSTLAFTSRCGTCPPPGNGTTQHHVRAGPVANSAMRAG
ncbi:hypothetical protein AB4851_07910 [Burkholderia sp. 22PA0099]|uniref:hypothetical protein n=1 Tax=Burkholderia sp. 22PA0099 TaxID=3237372 RepID=UPI0039C3FF2D